MVHVPTAAGLSVAPLTVQTLVVEEVNVTGKPELAVAVSVKGDAGNVTAAGAAKVMV
jgi:hypothetical protein